MFKQTDKNNGTFNFDLHYSNYAKYGSLAWS